MTSAIDAGAQARSATVLGPPIEPLLAFVEDRLRTRNLPIYPSAIDEPSPRLRLYGQTAAALIRLNHHVVASLKHRFGDDGSAYLLIQGAFDPHIRNPIGWIRSFLSEDKASKTVDTRGSFRRWSKELASIGPQATVLGAHVQKIEAGHGA